MSTACTLNPNPNLDWLWWVTPVPSLARCLEQRRPCHVG